MKPDNYKIGGTAGYTSAIADLVSMMNYARSTTLDTVEGLTVSQLDHLHDSESNSIGGLLLHFAAVEHYYAALSFQGRGLTEEETAYWGAALDLGQPGRENIRGHDLNFYLEKLAAVRARTLAELAQKDDEWLRTEAMLGTLPSNHYFMWFHVFEDEINHRGQIRWLRKRLPA